MVSYEEFRESEQVMVACRAYLEEASRELDVLVTPSATGEGPRGAGQHRRHRLQHPGHLDPRAMRDPAPLQGPLGPSRRVATGGSPLS